MSLKKVIFHPLERLDIIDIDGLQDLAHLSSQDIAGAILGSGIAGMAEGFSIATVDNLNDRIQFGDFSFVNRFLDPDGNSRHTPVFMGKFRQLVANGLCEFGSYKDAVQNYYNTNDQLPPVPTSELFDITAHGQYYPYIYVRPVVTEATPASRRFWSVGDNAEVTDTVNTRSGVYFQFTLASPNEGTPLSDSEFVWTRVAGINSWEVSANVVSLDSSGISRYFFADAMLDVAGAGRVAEDTHGAAIRKGGVAGAVSWILAHIDAMKSGGTEDPASTPSLQRYELPRYSLSGLGYLHDNLRLEFDALKLVDSSAITVQLSFNTGLPTLSYSSDPASTFTITPYLNFQPAREFLQRVYGATVTELTSTEWDTYFAGESVATQVLASIALQVPEAYRNRFYTLEVTPIYSDRGAEFISSGLGDINDAQIYQQFKQGESWHLLASSPETVNAPRKLSLLSRQTKESSTAVLFTGVNIGQRGAINWSDLDAYNMRFDLKITLAVLRQ